MSVPLWFLIFYGILFQVLRTKYRDLHWAKFPTPRTDYANINVKFAEGNRYDVACLELQNL